MRDKKPKIECKGDNERWKSHLWITCSYEEGHKISLIKSSPSTNNTHW